MTENKKKLNTPKKGAARKWAEKFEKLREQELPENFVAEIRRRYERKKSAISQNQVKDLDV
jgi:hypothetical protein